MDDPVGSHNVRVADEAVVDVTKRLREQNQIRTSYKQQKQHTNTHSEAHKDTHTLRHIRTETGQFCLLSDT